MPVIEAEDGEVEVTEEVLKKFGLKLKLKHPKFRVEKMIRWCAAHVDKDPPQIKNGPLQTTDLFSLVPAEEATFLTELDMVEALELARVCEEAGCEPLLRLAGLRIATLLKEDGFF